jgi:hypothetical protein
MTGTFYSVIVAPLLGWATALSLVVVAYLASLEISERRRNRRLDAKREQLGLR